MNRLGPYDLLGVLGRGGMGTVYRARHRETGEEVAVKALAQNHNEDDHFRQRFESEIQALLKLDHPNIVRLIGYGQEDGAMYFAMELVEGKSLFHLQREIKTFDWRDVLVIARDVATGLRHAHDRGIVHRDLKPGNLLKSDEGMIKITDFGIAKAYGVSHDTRDNVVGTIDFMSPEQALGRPVTAKSDLYSLGVVLYTLLSGTPPFASSSIEQSLRNLTRVPAPKIRSRVPSVPDSLEEIIDELLEKKPEKRTPTAYALLRKLDYVEQLLRDGSEAATSHGGAGPGVTARNPVRPAGPARTSPPAAGAGSSRGASSPGTPAAGTPAAGSVSSRGPAAGRPEQAGPGEGLSPEATFRLGKPAGSEPDPAPSARSGNPAAGSSSARDAGTNRRPPARDAATRASRETVVQTSESAREELLQPPPRVDFFNPVTDDERRKVFQRDDDPEQRPSGRGWIPVFLLLVLVLGMTAYGIRQAFQVEPATVLYERIAEKADQPYYVRSEIKQFLENYPNDDRVERVRELNDVALAMQKFKLLSTKARLPGDRGPTLLEQEFVDVIELAERDPAVGLAKLEAFIRLHDAGDETPAATMELVSAARYYLKKITDDSAFQRSQDRNAAINALMRARTNPAEAADIYKSVIELFQGKDWVAEQVEQARKELELLEGGKSGGDGSGDTGTDAGPGPGVDSSGR